MKKLISLLVFLVMVYVVSATWDITLNYPQSDIDIYPLNRDVNFTWIATTVNEVLNVSDTMNCSIYNSSDNINFSVLGGPYNVTNATTWNKSIHLPYSTHYVFINCSTTYTADTTHDVSTTNTFNISIKENYANMAPADNAILDIVETNFTWNISVENVNIPENLICAVQTNSSDGATSLSAKTDLFTPITIENSSISNKSLSLDNLKTYQWRVNCSNGSIDFLSDTRSFMVNLSYDYHSRTPEDGRVNRGFEINFSWNLSTLNVDLAEGNSFNCTVKNSSAIGDNKTALFTPINTTNNTINHKMVTMANTDETWWQMNCSNGSIDWLSDTRNFNIDIEQDYNWRNPVDEAVLGSVEVNYSWRIAVTDVNLNDGASMNCTVQNASAAADNKTSLFGWVNTTNNTVTHQVYTMENRDDVYWSMNCSNGSVDFLSDTYSFSIDSDLTTTIVNPTVDEVLTSRYVNYSWKFEATNINLSAGESLNCTGIRNGTVIFGGPDNGGENTTNSTETNRTISTINGHYNFTVNCSNSLGEYFEDITGSREFTVAESTGDALNIELLYPPAVAVLASPTVNFTWRANLTGGFLNPGDELECALLNRSSSAGNYSVLFKDNMTNGTIYNQTFDVKTSERHHWKVNCSTPVTQPGYISQLSETRLFDVYEDEVYFKYGIGFFDKINFTLNTGDFQFAGFGTIGMNLSIAGNLTIGTEITPSNITMRSPNSSIYTCGPADDGTWECMSK